MPAHPILSASEVEDVVKILSNSAGCLLTLSDNEEATSSPDKTKSSRPRRCSSTTRAQQSVIGNKNIQSDRSRPRSSSYNRRAPRNNDGMLADNKELSNSMHERSDVSKGVRQIALSMNADSKETSQQSNESKSSEAVKRVSSAGCLSVVAGCSNNESVLSNRPRRRSSIARKSLRGDESINSDGDDIPSKQYSQQPDEASNSRNVSKGAEGVKRISSAGCLSMLTNNKEVTHCPKESECSEIVKHSSSTGCLSMLAGGKEAREVLRRPAGRPGRRSSFNRPRSNEENENHPRRRSSIKDKRKKRFEGVNQESAHSGAKDCNAQSSADKNATIKRRSQRRRSCSLNQKMARGNDESTNQNCESVCSKQSNHSNAKKNRPKRRSSSLNPKGLRDSQILQIGGQQLNLKQQPAVDNESSEKCKVVELGYNVDHLGEGHVNESNASLGLNHKGELQEEQTKRRTSLGYNETRQEGQAKRRSSLGYNEANQGGQAKCRSSLGNNEANQEWYAKRRSNQTEVVGQERPGTRGTSLGNNGALSLLYGQGEIETLPNEKETGHDTESQSKDKAIAITKKEKYKTMMSSSPKGANTAYNPGENYITKRSSKPNGESTSSNPGEKYNTMSSSFPNATNAACKQGDMRKKNMNKTGVMSMSIRDLKGKVQSNFHSSAAISQGYTSQADTMTEERKQTKKINTSERDHSISDNDIEKSMVSKNKYIPVEESNDSENKQLFASDTASGKPDTTVLLQEKSIFEIAPVKENRVPEKRFTFSSFFGLSES